MSLATMLAVTALAAAIYLLSQQARIYAIVAALVAGLQVAMAMGWVTFAVKGLPLPLITAVVLTGCGAMLFIKSLARLPVAAATLITFVGLLQLLAALRVL